MGSVWHDLRHTFISRLVMAKIPLAIIQELAGHKTIAMTVRDAHLSQDREIEALRQMSDFQKGANLPSTLEKQISTRTAPEAKRHRKMIG